MKRMQSMILVAAGLFGFAIFAFAQMPPGHHHGLGDPLAMLEGVKGSLNLNTAQQQQWDNTLVQSKAAHTAARDNFGQLRTAMQTELAKAEPDLAALAALTDSIEQQNSALRKEARNTWLALYATFTVEQKQVVRDAITTRLQKLAAMRAHRRQQRGG
jgi:Spy/CpxP family protein refolding chaperone